MDCRRSFCFALYCICYVLPKKWWYHIIRLASYQITPCHVMSCHSNAEHRIASDRIGSHGVPWHSMAQHGAARHGMAWHGALHAEEDDGPAGQTAGQPKENHRCSRGKAPHGCRHGRQGGRTREGELGFSTAPRLLEARRLRAPIEVLQSQGRASPQPVRACRLGGEMSRWAGESACQGTHGGLSGRLQLFDNLPVREHLLRMLLYVICRRVGRAGGGIDGRGGEGGRGENGGGRKGRGEGIAVPEEKLGGKETGTGIGEDGAGGREGKDEGGERWNGKGGWGGGDWEATGMLALEHIDTHMQTKQIINDMGAVVSKLDVPFCC